MQLGVKETVPMVKLKKDKVKKKKDEIEIRHEVVGDDVKFLCDHCEYKGGSKTAVKSHMAKKHRGEKRARGDEEGDDKEPTKKAKPDDENPDDTMESLGSEDEDDSEDDDFIDDFDDDGNLKVPENSQEEKKEEAPEKTTEDKDDEVKMLNEEIVVKNAKIETLEEALKLKEELLNMANAKVASLEIDNIEKDSKTEKYKRIAKKTLNNEPDESRKLKKEVAAKTKEVEDLKIKLADSLKKTRDEIMLRAKAEADLISKQQTVEVMSDIMMKQGNQTSSNEQKQGAGENRGKQLCRDALKPQGCSWGKRCMYFHPPGSIQTSAQSGDSPDCSFWLNGFCKYSESECRGKHEPSKCGSKPRRSTQLNSAEINKPDFVQTLARAVSQSLAGAQPQVVAPPSTGQQMASLPQQMMQQQMFPQMIPQMMIMPSNAAMYYPHLKGGQGGVPRQ